MKHHRINAALIALCGLIALATVLVSASGGEKVTVILLSFLLWLASIIVGSLLVSHALHTQRRVLPVLIAPVMATGIIVSVAATHWPLRLSYAMSRGTFDSIAQHVRAGEQVKPRRVGLFAIRRAEIFHNG